jgi:hypothetical protein
MRLAIVVEKYRFHSKRRRNRIVEAMDALYEYMLDWSKGSKRGHVDGERSFIERCIRRDEFETLFGGEMILTDPSGRTEFIGSGVEKR